MLQTLYLSREPADIFNKSIEKNTINYLSKAYSFIMNIFMNTAKQVDIFIVKTNNDFSLSWTYDSTIPKILRREAETLDRILFESMIIWNVSCGGFDVLRWKTPTVA